MEKERVKFHDEKNCECMRDFLKAEYIEAEGEQLSESGLAALASRGASSVAPHCQALNWSWDAVCHSI